MTAPDDKELRKQISKSMAVTFGKQVAVGMNATLVKQLHEAGVDEILALITADRQQLGERIVEGFPATINGPDDYVQGFDEAIEACIAIVKRERGGEDA